MPPNLSIWESLMTHSAERADDTSAATKEAQDSVADHEPNDEASARGLFFRLKKYGYRRFPSYIPDPDRHELLEMYRRYDADNNAKSEPPFR